MARKGPVRKRKVDLDLVYQNAMVTKFINRSMYDGKKSVAQKEIYSVLEIVKEKTNENLLDVFEKAFSNIRSEMEVRFRRIGGVAYQVPM